MLMLNNKLKLCSHLSDPLFPHAKVNLKFMQMPSSQEAKVLIIGNIPGSNHHLYRCDLFCPAAL